MMEQCCLVLDCDRTASHMDGMCGIHHATAEQLSRERREADHCETESEQTLDTSDRRVWNKVVALTKKEQALKARKQELKELQDILEQRQQGINELVEKLNNREASIYKLGEQIEEQRFGLSVLCNIILRLLTQSANCSKQRSSAFEQHMKDKLLELDDRQLAFVRSQEKAAAIMLYARAWKSFVRLSSSVFILLVLVFCVFLDRLYLDGRLGCSLLSKFRAP